MAKKVMQELGILENKFLSLYCDNKAAINITHDQVQYDRTKHVEIDRHFTKEKLTGDQLSRPFVKLEQ